MDITKNFLMSICVPQAGIEPAHLTVHDFESCASTSSATKAFLLQFQLLVQLQKQGANMGKL
jgi:hypothetical protein